MNQKTEVRIPKRLKLRPQWRGLPIPYVALIRDDGTPDFRVTDEHKRRSVIQNRWCQLCGNPLGKWMFFTGGTKAAKHNAYFEPGCHLDCLIYAMQVCPFIVGRMEHADVAKIQKQYAEKELTIKADDTFAAERNPLWVIKKAVGYSYTLTKDKTLLLVPMAIKATPPLKPEEMSPREWNKVMEWLAK